MTITADHTTENVAIAAVPASATESRPDEAGFMFSRDSKTLVTDAGTVDARINPISLQQRISLEIVDGQIVAQADDEPLIMCDIEAVTVAGAKTLVQALHELIAACEARS